MDIAHTYTDGMTEVSEDQFMKFLDRENYTRDGWADGEVYYRKEFVKRVAIAVHLSNGKYYIKL